MTENLSQSPAVNRGASSRTQKISSAVTPGGSPGPSGTTAGVEIKEPVAFRGELDDAKALEAADGHYDSTRKAAEWRRNVC